MTPLQLTWCPASCDPSTSEEPGRQEKTRRYKGRQECTNHFRINLAVIQTSCHLFTRALFCCHCKCYLCTLISSSSNKCTELNKELIIRKPGIEVLDFCAHHLARLIFFTRVWKTATFWFNSFFWDHLGPMYGGSGRYVKRLMKSFVSWHKWAINMKLAPLDNRWGRWFIPKKSPT